MRNPWRAQVVHFKPLIAQVIEQTERRVFKGEKVPAAEKLFSLFEEHTDIIVKGRRDIQFGHELNLYSGKSGMILDVVIEAGNPADSDRFLSKQEQHIDHYGKAPRQMAAMPARRICGMPGNYRSRMSCSTRSGG